MPIYKKHRNVKKYVIWAIIILMVILMLASFPNHPVFNEVVLFP